MKSGMKSGKKSGMKDMTVGSVGRNILRFAMPMLVGQATTPWVFECMIAYGLTGESGYLNP